MEEPLDLEFGFLERYARISTVPRLSIVIPCLVCDKRFENTLASVLQNRPDHCEVLVAVAGSYDDPYELENEVGFVETSADASLVELINLGVAHAGGDVVHVLQCGLEVPEGWTSEPLRRFDDESIAAVSPWIVSASRSAGRATVGVAYGNGGKRRECQLPLSRPSDPCRNILGPTLRAAFYRREVFCAVGGLDAGIGPELADIDMALSLRAAGYAAACEPASHISAAEEPRHSASAFDQGSRAEFLFWKHATHQGWLGSVTAHVLLVGGEMLRAVFHPSLVASLFGRLHGCACRPSRRTRPYPFSDKRMRPRSRQRTRSPGGNLRENSGEPQPPAAKNRRHVA